MLFTQYNFFIHMKQKAKQINYIFPYIYLSFISHCLQQIWINCLILIYVYELY